MIGRSTKQDPTRLVFLLAFFVHGVLPLVSVVRFSDLAEVFVRPVEKAFGTEPVG